MHSRRAAITTEPEAGDSIARMIEALADPDGILLRRDAIQQGVDDDALRRLVRAGQLVRIRQGAYVVASSWLESTEVERHHLLSNAVRQVYSDGVALSHLSASVEHGSPTWGMDLTAVHLTSLDGTAQRSGAKIVHHRGSCSAGDLTRDARGWLTAPTRTALDSASMLAQEAGVALLDWYLHEGLTSSEELATAFASMRRWPNTLGLHRILQLADASAESVGETRTRLMCRRERLPAPIPQYQIFHPDGRLAGRVDFAWPHHRTMLEFDGMAKYHRYRRPGESIAEAVMREKLREDMLRELTGWRMIRIIWADLERPRATAARIARALALPA